MAERDRFDVVRKLLAKAERAATPEEAETYSAKAQELMLRYSIDTAVLSSILDQEREGTDVVGRRRFELRFYPKQKAILLSTIASAFGCEAVRFRGRGNSGTGLVEVFGWESDLAIVEILYASLDVQASGQVKQRLAKLRASGDSWTHGRAFTSSFLLGFAVTVSDRLSEQRRGAVSEAEDTHPGTALVLVDRKKAVDRELYRAHPHTRNGRASASSGVGFRSGEDAGRTADLGTGGSTLGARGRLSLR